MNFEKYNEEKVKEKVKVFFIELRKEIGINYTVSEMKEFSETLIYKVNHKGNYRIEKNPFKFVELSPAISLSEVSDILSGIKKTILKFDVSFSFLLKLIDEIYEDEYFDNLKSKKDSMRRVKVPIGFEIDFKKNSKKEKEMNLALESFSGEIVKVKDKKANRNFINSSFERGCFRKVKNERKRVVKNEREKSTKNYKKEIENTNILLKNLL